jgi:hypothetical protein
MLFGGTDQETLYRDGAASNFPFVTYFIDKLFIRACS